MPPRPPHRERLSQLANDRRLELDLTWEQVAEAAGLTYETIRAARNDNAEIRPLTRRAIAAALQWTPGSVDLILQGDDPVPAGGPPPGPRAAAGAPRLAAVPDAAPLGEDPSDEDVAEFIALQDGWRLRKILIVYWKALPRDIALDHIRKAAAAEPSAREPGKRREPGA
jgi:hypothetical protein